MDDDSNYIMCASDTIDTKFELEQVVEFEGDYYVIANIMLSDINITNNNYMYLIVPIKNYKKEITLQGILTLEDRLNYVDKDRLEMLGLLYE